MYPGWEKGEHVRATAEKSRRCQFFCCDALLDPLRRGSVVPSVEEPQRGVDSVVER